MNCLYPLIPMLALLSGPILTFVSLIFADIQVTTNPVTEAVPQWATGTGVVIGMLGGPVFAIWYAYYMTTSRIPAIEKAHSEQLTEARKQHGEYVQTLITNYRQDVQQMWTTKREDDNRIAALRREDDNKLIAAIDRLSERMEDHSCKYPGN